MPQLPRLRPTAAALAVALTLASSVPLFAAPSVPTAGWQQFRHSEFGFTINYPPGWDVLSGTGRAAFVAIGPAVEGMPGVRLGVVVVTARIPAGANVEEAGAKLEEQLARSAQTVRVLRTDRINLRGLPAVITYVHRRNSQGVDLYQMLMIVAHRSRGYGVAGNTAVASPTMTEDTRLLQRIILTFEPPK